MIVYSVACRKCHHGWTITFPKPPEDDVIPICGACGEDLVVTGRFLALDLSYQAP